MNSPTQGAESPSAIASQLYPYHLQPLTNYVESSPPLPPQPTHASRDTHFRRSLTSPPPIPPKPLSSSVHSTRPTDGSSVQPAPIPVVPVHLPEQNEAEPNDEDDLAVALALSQSENVEKEKHLARLANQEEEDLAKALAESMLSAGGSLYPSSQQHSGGSSEQPDDLERAIAESMLSIGLSAAKNTSSASAGPSKLPADNMLPFARYDKWRMPEIPNAPLSSNEVGCGSQDAINPDEKGKQRMSASELAYMHPEVDSESAPSPDNPSISSVNNYPKIDHDTALTRRVASEGDSGSYLSTGQNEKTAAAGISLEHAPQDDLPQYTSSCALASIGTVLPSEASTIHDEAFARRLAAEEDATVMGQSHFHDAKYQPSDPSAEVRSGEPSPLGIVPPYTHETPLLSPSGVPNANESSRSRSNDIASTHGDFGSTIPSTELRRHDLKGSRSQSFHNIPSTSVDVMLLQPEELAPHTPSLVRVSSMSSLPSISHSSESGLSPQSVAAPNPSVVNLNYFIDAELLVGVSMGFMSPAITTNLVPMQGALPNIISLPYGRSPPLHMQGTTWRHLLKLMARMSGSRMEAAMEALAVSKNENMKLRTVIQFIKAHPLSEWRTVLWFTIDHPIPPGLPGAHKYHSHNVNILPWSYTLSKIPDVLHDAADTPVSKTYTIPSTDAVPYPTLPITLPNLAMYLQAALEESRNYLSDSSSGLRKLAKMVETCYPSAEDISLEPPERTSMGGLFKRVIGRGNKSSKKGRGNEDTYDLVTPFVPDEWG
ncbi:hypothetical protein BDQ12DRAFT_675338 [Crucibulum laeve]|uniref:Uncharacterized protein n=1 Tax=Crucibulum laeve TaxID=68775 RepID=A0A5C3ME34_9AGAR|nr:hypothetical protein BDQ12DRAFT_675338 [Crucibulum laeve]